MTHSFPTRRSSDLVAEAVVLRESHVGPSLRSSPSQRRPLSRGNGFHPVRPEAMGSTCGTHCLRWAARSAGVVVAASSQVMRGSRPNHERWRRATCRVRLVARSEEHTSELQSLMRISYAVFCLKNTHTHTTHPHYSTPTHNHTHPT